MSTLKKETKSKEKKTITQPAKQSQQTQRTVDEASEESFPASDPPAWTGSIAT